MERCDNERREESNIGEIGNRHDRLLERVRLRKIGGSEEAVKGGRSDGSFASGGFVILGAFQSRLLRNLGWVGPVKDPDKHPRIAL